MKKTIKKISIAYLVICILYLTTFPTFAYSLENTTVKENREAVPYLDNCDMCTFSFSVIESGEAIINVRYHGKTDTFLQAKLSVKIQKKFLGLFWKTVDIGEPNNVWTAYSNNVNGNFYNSFMVNDTGTYRALFTVEISGINNNTDIIEHTIECKYK